MKPADEITLATYTDEHLCLPNLHGRDAATVIFELSRALAATGAVDTPMWLGNVALNRYYLAPEDQTGGVAYLVATVPALTATRLAVGVSEEECCWRRNTQPVYVVFLIATPARDGVEAEGIVRAIKRAAVDRAVLRLLHSAPTGATLRAALATVPLPGPEDVLAPPSRMHG